MMRPTFLRASSPVIRPLRLTSFLSSSLHGSASDPVARISEMEAARIRFQKAEESAVEAQKKLQAASVLGYFKWNRIADKAASELVQARDLYKSLAVAEMDAKLSAMEEKFLRLKNNFNLRGALEYALEEFASKRKSKGRPAKVLDDLVADPKFVATLEAECEAFQLRVRDALPSVRVLYHELSKHAHGNMDDLIIHGNEHAPGELVALVSVFKFLKAQGTHTFTVKLNTVNRTEEF